MEVHVAISGQHMTSCDSAAQCPPLRYLFTSSQESFCISQQPI